MKLTHTADDGLAGLMVTLDGEGRIFLCKFAESDSKFVKVSLSLRLHCDSDNGIREYHLLKNDRMRLVADGVTSAEVFETNGCADVSSLYELDRVLVVRVHLIQTCDSFFLACTGIENIRPGVYFS